MALATTCPHCKTSFRLVPDQLKLRRGLVRCGVCRQVFSGVDALRYLEDPVAASATQAVPAMAGEPGSAAPGASSSAGIAAPELSAPEIPAPEEPALEVPGPEVPTPEILAPEVPAPEVPAPEVPAPEVPAPEVPAPEVPAPEVPAPEVPAPEVPAPGAPPPEIPPPEAPAPEVPPQELPAPEVPAPEIPVPGAPAPEIPVPGLRAPDAPVPGIPAPEASAAETPQPGAAAPRPGEAFAPAPERPPFSQETPSLFRSGRSAVRDEPPPALEPEIDEPGEADAVDFFGDGRRARGFTSRGAAFASVGVVALAALLAMQLLIGSRHWLAARVPPLEPVLALLAAPLGLQVEPPRENAALTIESFEMQPGGADALFVLNALLRNKASHVVQWPALELSLLDAEGKVVVRKVLQPSDYLGQASEALRTGVRARAEVPVRTAVQVRDVEPTGYRVRLVDP